MQTTHTSFSTSTSTITTADNTPIAITQYSATHPKASIVIGGATGVPKRFYKHFALAANAAGYHVFTLDYRGTGDSAPPSLKGYKADYLDWAKQDLAALVEHADESGLPIFLVGHSYGGQALGLLPNVDKIKAAYVFGTGAGYSGWMPMLERIKVTILWNILAPVVVRVNGYLAWSKFGMGEDLPLGIYKQWKRWCSFPNYFFDDPNMHGLQHAYSRYSNTLVSVNATDDKWATGRSRDVFMPYYTNAKHTRIDLSPSEYGLKEVAHMGYFFKHAHAIWSPIFDCFEVELAHINDTSK